MNLFELLEAGNSKFPEIAFVKGFLYHNGLGVERDDAKALTLFQSACENGMIVAHFSVAMILLERVGGGDDNAAEAIEHLSIAADSDFVPALLQLALMYEFGQFVSPNARKAFEYKLRAAKLGCDVAAVDVAQRLEHGYDGQEPDVGLALTWYLRAAEDGNSMAHERLAEIYQNGELGVAKDKTLAAERTQSAEVLMARQQGEELRRYRVAALNGHRGSQKVLSEIYRLGGYGVEIDSEKSAYWRNKFMETNEN